MAKICKQCGIKYENSATKCIVCGTEFKDTHIYSRRKKLLIFGIIGVILVLATIFIAILSTTPEAAVWRIMEAHRRNDLDAVVATFPDFLLESEVIDKNKFMLNTQYAMEEFSQYIFSYSIGKAETPNSNEREKYMEIFRYFGGSKFQEDKIEDIKMVWVNYKGNIIGFWPSRGTRFIVFKYDGDWCWWPSNIGR